MVNEESDSIIFFWDRLSEKGGNHSFLVEGRDPHRNYVVWLGKTQHLLTTGFARGLLQDRKFTVN